MLLLLLCRQDVDEAVEDNLCLVEVGAFVVFIVLAVAYHHAAQFEKDGAKDRLNYFCLERVVLFLHFLSQQVAIVDHHRHIGIAEMKAYLVLHIQCAVPCRHVRSEQTLHDAACHAQHAAIEIVAHLNASNDDVRQAEQQVALLQVVALAV